MSLANELEELNTQRNDLAANLTTKGVAATSSETLAQLVPKVLDISTGGGAPPAVSSEAVNFYDYDGMIVASWTLAELASATALPANPTHAGLTSQGWNYTLAQLKTENRSMNVGQMYITDDGKTRLYIKIATLGRMTVPLYWSQTVDSGVTIDWGDGSATQTFTGTGNKNTTHVYTAVGDYIISLEVTAGELRLGDEDGSWDYGVFGDMLYSGEGRVYSNMLQKLEVGSGISNIGNDAFGLCQSLVSVTIPVSVTSIGDAAFSNCYSLAFVTIPTGMTSISNTAFYRCYSLESVAIPAGVTSIADAAFSYCTSLTSVVLPISLTSIGGSAFQYDFSLESVAIPIGITIIEYMTFSACYALKSIVIPASVTTIVALSFYECRSLTSVVIPPSVKSIQNNAFQGCTSLKSVIIPASVTSIWSSVFKSCTHLNSVIIPESVTDLASAQSVFDSCFSLTSVVIPRSVTKIGNYMFAGCNSLPFVDIPTGVTSIGNYAFNGCNSLASVVIPAGVTSIGTNAFQNCYSLASVVIPTSVTSIGTNAFNGCVGVAEYHLMPTTPPTLTSANVFSSIPSDCIIYVPLASLAKYQAAAYWSTYASRMVGE